MLVAENTICKSTRISKGRYTSVENCAEICKSTSSMFIYGRNDTIFETSLLNEKVIYYAYKNNKLKDEK